MTRPALQIREGYQPQTIEKVERLLEFLDETYRHPLLKRSTLLYGGTALNVFHLGMPRLSVDADIQYVGAADRVEMLAEQAEVLQALVNLSRAMGYQVGEGREGEDGRTFTLHYVGQSGPDTVKVDVNFINRVPLLGADTSVCGVCSPEVRIGTFKLAEIIGGKMQALFARVAVRDLYDVYRMQSDGLLDHMAERDNDEGRLCRRVILYYVSLSRPFPQRSIDGAVVDRFSNRQNEVESQLYPVLHAGDRPSLGQMMEAVRSFVETHVIPRDAEEHEYLKRLADGVEYQPRLLFEQWDEVARRAEASPAAARKVQNLAGRPSGITMEDEGAEDAL